MTTALASRPWKLSTLATSTPSAPGISLMRSHSNCTWAMYGDCTAIEDAGTPVLDKK